MALEINDYILPRLSMKELIEEVLLYGSETEKRLANYCLKLQNDINILEEVLERNYNWD